MKRSSSTSFLASTKSSLLPTYSIPDDHRVNLVGLSPFQTHRAQRRLSNPKASKSDADVSSSGERWVRIILIFCVLGGCLLFTGEKPPIKDVKVKVLALTGDRCADTLKFPKIALMFLLKGPMYHGEIWEEWLNMASGALPAEYVRDFACENKSGSRRLYGIEPTSDGSSLLGACRGNSPAKPLSTQYLYSIYVHLSEEINLNILKEHWAIHARNISRVVTKWGHHSLVEATRNLLVKAFEDPANQRFMLLSESHIPIWDSLTVYRLAMNEKRSFINAWWHDDMNENRWTRKMEPVIPLQHWRKSQQWFSLIREHVSIILEDKEVYKAFYDHCVYEWDFDNMKHRKCFSDEHYFATLLSIKGIEDETVPFYATNTMVDWSDGGAHPKSFGVEDVSAEKIKFRLRSHHDCPISEQDQKETQESSRFSFISIDKINESDDKERICDIGKSHSDVVPGIKLPAGCTSFARKFEQGTTDAIMRTFSRCDQNLGIFKCHEQ